MEDLRLNVMMDLPHAQLTVKGSVRLAFILSRYYVVVPEIACIVIKKNIYINKTNKKKCQEKQRKRREMTTLTLV